MDMKKKNYFYRKNEPYLIAEIASAHHGDKRNIYKLVKHAHKSKFDAIKLQIFNTDNFVSKYNSNYKILKKLEFNYIEWKKIINKLKRYKNDWIVEIFDYESLVFCESLDFFDIYKVSASCFYEKRIIDYILQLKKNVIISVGGIDFKEIKLISNKLSKQNINFCLMLGHQNFPTQIDDLNLNKIKYLKQNLKCNVGYADHVNANKLLSSFSIPLLAYFSGAEIIEKHINIDRELKKNDYFSSLNLNELKSFVEYMHTHSRSIGEKSYKLSKAEIKYNAFSKKYLVAIRTLNIGDKINESSISFKRVNEIGINESQYQKLKNKLLNKKIKKDQIIRKQDLKNE